MNQQNQTENTLYKKISFEAYVLDSEVESKLKNIVSSILEAYKRLDLVELIYMSAKELVINSTKAAIKRAYFFESGKNFNDTGYYDSAMKDFKLQLNRENMPLYKEKIKKNKLKTKINFIHNDEKIIIKVISNFLLLPQEETRVREKFLKAQKYDNLVEFYMEHGDNTEGAGLGITLVEILMAQNGFDRHLFTIYTSKNSDETIAKVIIPLDINFKSTREKFDEEVRSKNLAKDELRKVFVLNEC